MEHSEGLWSAKALAIRVGETAYKASPLPLMANRVPRELQPLLHYAATWGAISEEAQRNEVLAAMPTDVLKNLRWVVGQFDDVLTAWLTGTEAESSSPTLEYVAFSDLHMAYDYALIALRKRGLATEAL